MTLKKGHPGFKIHPKLRVEEFIVNPVIPNLRHPFAVVMILIATTSLTVPILDADTNPDYIKFIDIIDSNRAWNIIHDLSGEHFEGRRSGTHGADLASDYIMNYFSLIGLQPAGEKGGYKATFQVPLCKTVDEELGVNCAGQAKGYNVLGFIHGSDPDASQKAVIVGAHYDNGGRDENGAVLPGADDNSSGVAVMMEIARAFSIGIRPKWSVLFAAWSGEEEGLYGSDAYAEHPYFPLNETIAYLNLDMVGAGEELLCEISQAHKTLFQTMDESRGELHIALSVEDFYGDSDHETFENNNVPNLMFIYWPDSEYHTARDTIDYISRAKLLDVARLTALITLKLSEATIMTMTTDTSISTTLVAQTNTTFRTNTTLPTTPLSFIFAGLSATQPQIVIVVILLVSIAAFVYFPKRKNG